MKTIFTITGMHCTSCEQLINLTLGELPGVKNVQTSYGDGECLLESDQPLDPQSVTNAIVELGYQATLKKY